MLRAMVGKKRIVSQKRVFMIMYWSGLCESCSFHVLLKSMSINRKWIFACSILELSLTVALNVTMSQASI